MTIIFKLVESGVMILGSSLDKPQIRFLFMKCQIVVYWTKNPLNAPVLEGSHGVPR